MRCEEARNLIPYLVMGVLSGEEKDELLKHIEQCSECRKFYERELERENILEFPEVMEPPPELRVRIWEKIERGKSRREKLLPILAPVLASILIFAGVFLTFNILKTKPLEATPVNVKLLYPGDKPIFSDDLEIILVVEGGEDIDISVKMDGQDISGSVREEDGVLFINSKPPSEGLHTLTITITDFKTGTTKEIVRNFFVVGG